MIAASAVLSFKLVRVTPLCVFEATPVIAHDTAPDPDSDRGDPAT
jgi:hypothetical protein